jgi:hypothetical protein
MIRRNLHAEIAVGFAALTDVRAGKQARPAHAV